jgi:hypothetical protein
MNSLIFLGKKIRQRFVLEKERERERKRELSL